MSWIDDMKRDREAGTTGKWRTFNGTDVFPDDDDTEGNRHIADCSMSVHLFVCEQNANARRIARVPDMEAALLAAEELAAAVQQYLALPADRMTNRIERALAAFRLATGGGA